jgi:hypothetical protein
VVVEIGIGANRRCALWDTVTGAEIASLPAGRSIVFSPDSNKLFSDEALRNARNGQIISAPFGESSAFIFSPDSAHLLIAGVPERYSGKAQLILVFGSMVALLISGRTVPSAASAQRARGLRAFALRGMTAGVMVGAVVLLAAAFTVRNPFSLLRLSCTGFVLAAWFFGGMELFHHYLLRVLVVREDVLPWRWTRLLDFSVQLALLRRVGDGYIFTHRLLLDHLAKHEAQGMGRDVLR